MKCVVFAYHNIGCAGIKALIRNGFEIAAVFTHKDNPNENIWFESVAELAAKEGIPVYAPENVNHPLIVKSIADMNPEVVFSFYYRDILSEDILTIPKVGAFNLHGSLLPKYRGRVPINWAIINGEKETGITLHYMTRQADKGDIVAQEAFAIEDADTAKTLFDKAETAAAVLLDKALVEIKNKTVKGTPQNEAAATCFGGRKPADGEIDWTKKAVEVRNLVRAVTAPYPGAFSFLGERKCFFWAVKVSAQQSDAAPGTVISLNPLTIACGEGAVEIEFAQQENGLYQSGDQFADSARIFPNMIFSQQISAVMKSKRRKSVLILGVNGFIGSWLSERLLESGDYDIYGMDLRSNYISHLLDHENFHFTEGDVQIHYDWIEYHIRKCDVILPLVAICDSFGIYKKSITGF